MQKKITYIAILMTLTAAPFSLQASEQLLKGKRVSKNVLVEKLMLKMSKSFDVIRGMQFTGQQQPVASTASLDNH